MQSSFIHGCNKKRMLLYLYSNIQFQVVVFEHTEDIIYIWRFYLTQ